MGARVKVRGECTGVARTLVGGIHTNIYTHVVIQGDGG